MKLPNIYFSNQWSKSRIRRDIVTGSRCISNCVFARILLLSGFIFFSVGFSSWNEKILPSNFYNAEIQFIPQGFAMCFYGSLAIILGLYLFLILSFRIGSGFNEYNKKNRQIIIFRWGFPGLKRRYKFSYSFSEVDSLILEGQNGFPNLRNLELCLLLKSQIKITIIKLDAVNIYTRQEMEEFSADLAQFLQIPFKRNF